MEQENEFNPKERYWEASREYLARMRACIDKVEEELKKMGDQMDLNDKYQTDALESVVDGLVNKVRKQTERIGRDYLIEVRAINNAMND